MSKAQTILVLQYRIKRLRKKLAVASTPALVEKLWKYEGRLITLHLAD